jgi:hypothetical protein
VLYWLELLLWLSEKNVLCVSRREPTTCTKKRYLVYLCRSWIVLFGSLRKAYISIIMLNLVVFVYRYQTRRYSHMLKSSANEWFRLTSIEYQTTVDMCEGLIKIMLAMSVDCLGSPRPPISELGNLFGTSPMPRAPSGRSGRNYPHLREEMAYSVYNTTICTTNCTLLQNLRRLRARNDSP